MARRRHRLGAPGDRVGGYTEYKGSGSVPTWASSSWALIDGQGNVIGTGRQNGCSRIKAGARGDWISSHRCTYNFKLVRSGEVVACRSFGEGMAASCRVMKKPPRGFSGRRATKFGNGCKREGRLDGIFDIFKRKKKRVSPMSKRMIWEPGKPMQIFGRAKRKRRRR